MAITLQSFLGDLCALRVSPVARSRNAQWANASKKRRVITQSRKGAETQKLNLFPAPLRLCVSLLQDFRFCRFPELCPRLNDSNLILLYSADSTSFPGHLPLICCRYWLEGAYCAFTRPFTYENHLGFSGFPDVSNRRSVTDRTWLVHLFGMHNGGGRARV